MAYVEEAKESPANQYKDTENKENIPDLYSLHRGYFPGLPLSSSLSQLGAPVSPLSPPPLPSQVGTPLSHFSRKEIELLRRLSPFQGPSTYCFGFIQP